MCNVCAIGMITARLRLVHGIRGTVSSNNYYYGATQPPNEMTCVLSLLAQYTIITAIFLQQNIDREYTDCICELPWSKFKSSFILHRSEHKELYVFCN